MTKYVIAKWLTPGLTPLRLVFTTFGGSAHGTVTIEAEDVENGTWEAVDDLGNATGIPKTVGEKISERHINQFTGETVE